MTKINPKFPNSFVVYQQGKKGVEFTSDENDEPERILRK